MRQLELEYIGDNEEWPQEFRALADSFFWNELQEVIKILFQLTASSLYLQRNSATKHVVRLVQFIDVQKTFLILVSSSICYFYLVFVWTIDITLRCNKLSYPMPKANFLSNAALFYYKIYFGDDDCGTLIQDHV